MSKTKDRLTAAEITESRIRAFCVGLPAACGVPEEIAAIEGEANGKRFDLEVSNPNSDYRRKPGQSTRQRVKPAFAAWADLADNKKLVHGINLLCYANDCYGYNKQGLPHPKELIDTGARLAIAELEQPEVAALYTVAEATELSKWE